MRRHFLAMRPHRACNFSIRPVSRGDGRSAVAAAAYRAGARFYDERTGRVRNYRSKRDIMSVEMVGWEGDPEAMWNLVEAAETRKNSRVARDFIISLPAELPLDVQVKLTRGYALWIRDQFGLPSMVAIHAPVGHAADPFQQIDEEIIADLQPRYRKPPKPKGDPRNHHVHILTSTRRWDPIAGCFTEKVREFDDRTEGPKVVQACRGEWQKRVNSALRKHGVAERVDLRSYEKMIAAGDAPEGLVPQPKRGAASTGRSRRLKSETGDDTSLGGRRQKLIRDSNDALWDHWLLHRQLRREEAREDGSSQAIARAREVERRERAAVDREAISSAGASEEVEAAVERSASFDLAPYADPWLVAVQDARERPSGASDPQDEFDQEIDPETFENPDTKEAPRCKVRVVRRVRERVRRRGE